MSNAKPVITYEWRNITKEDRDTWLGVQYGNRRDFSLVWRNESWWRSIAYDGADDRANLHYPHASQVDSGMLAYTPSLAYGRANRQIRVKPGRYLAKFFSDILSAEQIKQFAEWQATGRRTSPYSDTAKYVLGFAHTPDEIALVYRHGPASCMGRQFSFDDHPCRVYGAGDLAIAYLRVDENKVTARALVWPDRHVFGRVYPTQYEWNSDGFRDQQDSLDAQNELKNRLRAAGYKNRSESDSHAFDGARLLKLEHREGWVMPYLDGDYGLCDSGEYWTMHREDNCEIAAQNTSGYIEDSSGRYSCEQCGDRIQEDETHYVRTSVHYGRTETWCEHCTENHTFYCTGSEECYSEYAVSSVVIDAETYAMGWAQQNGAYRSDYSSEWFFEESDPAVTMSDGRSTMSESEFADYGAEFEARTNLVSLYSVGQSFISMAWTILYAVQTAQFEKESV